MLYIASVGSVACLFLLLLAVRHARGVCDRSVNQSKCFRADPEHAFRAMQTQRSHTSRDWPSTVMVDNYRRMSKDLSVSLVLKCF